MSDVSQGSDTRGSAEILNRRPELGSAATSSAQDPAPHPIPPPLAASSPPQSDRVANAGNAGNNGPSFDDNQTPTMTPREAGSLDLTPTAEVSCASLYIYDKIIFNSKGFLNEMASYALQFIN